MNFKPLFSSLMLYCMTTASALSQPATEQTATSRRPDHVNNALSHCFPAVFSQDGGSCGSASRICYMFAHEINSFRNADARLPENIYPSHFTWLLTNSHSGKEGMAMANGVPSSVVYGGTTYSRVFGNQDCAAPDFGWMQGYDKWYSAMFNRIERNSFCSDGVDTEAGREYVKNWLWNHCGDTDFSTGGICGIGVASACHQGAIADDSTGTNRLAGVVGKKYVTRWGDGVDHALTIVGYDDRILFDLDGNGILGERDKDECGAWIIVNSWGNGWANEGFIYCPYQYGFPVRRNEGGSWKPEFYHVRKHYRPLRTLKVRMQYSRRSELKLRAGIAYSPDAAEPDTIFDMEHFKFAGDGRSDKQKMGLESRTPMLGRWADGSLHDEPMEFGYDLTDLSGLFDTRRPLKYFFIIESRKDAIGTGRLLSCSVIDYEFDRKGIETPLYSGRGLRIANGGERTVAAATVQGEPFFAPADLRLLPDSSTLAWNRPAPTHYGLNGYVLYADGLPADTLPATSGNYRLPEGKDAQTSIAALYAAGDTLIPSFRLPLRPASNLHHPACADSLKLSAATRPVASFAPSQAVAKAGERISFLPQHPQPGARYDWTMKGADIPFASTMNAAATFEQAGDYNIRLRVTNPLTGKSKRSSLRLHVAGSAPKAAFQTSPMVALRGTEISLTDQSRFAPTGCDWLVESRRYAIRTKGKKAGLRLDVPGVYDVTLTASNAYGEDKHTRRAALIICNADSRNGLNFSNPKAEITTDRSPYTGTADQLTVEWWMNASASPSVFGMGESAGTWHISGDAAGRLRLTADSLSISSPEGFVSFGSWHHYAVVFSQGTVLFYKDGEEAGGGTLGKKEHILQQLPQLTRLHIGGEKAPVSAVIDELRMWKKALPTADLRRYANAPLTETAQAEQTDSLLLYYDFNQNGGDVQDRTSHRCNGRRLNFGPDGDAWGLSSGVFCLNFDTELTDLSEELLPPSTRPFATTGRSINTRDAARFLEFDPSGTSKSWIVEGATGPDSLRTGVYVDRNKSEALTVCTGWDGFAPQLRNHKLYTVVRLPAGRYELELVPFGGMASGGSLLAAALGKGLPSIGEKDTTRILATAPVASRRLSFVLDRETEISLGLVFSLQGNSCIAIDRLRLLRSRYEEK